MFLRLFSFRWYAVGLLGEGGNCGLSPVILGLNNPVGVFGLGFVNNAAKTEFNNQFFGDNGDWKMSGLYGGAGALTGYGLGRWVTYQKSMAINGYGSATSWRDATYVRGGALLMSPYKPVHDFATSLGLATGLGFDAYQPKFEK